MAWSQSRNRCFGLTAMAERFTVSMCPLGHSCDVSFIAVVKTPDFGNSDDLAAWHDVPLVRGVLSQGQVGSGTMIVSEVAFQHTTQMSSIKNHDMIETLTANRANQSFCVRILPRAPGRGDNFLYRQGVDAATKLVAIDRVTIPNQVPPRITLREGLGHLLTRPF